MTNITVTDAPHGLHVDSCDGGTPVTLTPDAVSAILTHEGRATP